MSRKRPSFLVLSLMLVVGHSCFSQEYFLKLDKIRRGEVIKTKSFYEGHWVRLKTTNGQKHKGNYFVVDENTIKVNNQDIKLSDVSKIRFDNKHLFGGITLTSLGAPAFLLGVVVVGVEDIFVREDTNILPEVMATSGFLAFVSGIVILSNKDKFVVKKKWQLSILEK